MKFLSLIRNRTKSFFEHSPCVRVVQGARLKIWCAFARVGSNPTGDTPPKTHFLHSKFRIRKTRYIYGDCLVDIEVGVTDGLSLPCRAPLPFRSHQLLRILLSRFCFSSPHTSSQTSLRSLLALLPCFHSKRRSPSSDCAPRSAVSSLPLARARSPRRFGTRLATTSPSHAAAHSALPWQRLRSRRTQNTLPRRARVSLPPRCSARCPFPRSYNCASKPRGTSGTRSGTAGATGLAARSRSTRQSAWKSQCLRSATACEGN